MLVAHKTAMEVGVTETQLREQGIAEWMTYREGTHARAPVEVELAVHLEIRALGCIDAFAIEVTGPADRAERTQFAIDPSQHIAEAVRNGRGQNARAVRCIRNHIQVGIATGHEVAALVTGQWSIECQLR